MKRILTIMAAAIAALTLFSCGKNGAQEEVLNTSWSKALKEVTWLSNFPEYTYDFQFVSTADIGSTSMCMASDRQGTPEKKAEYIEKLTKQGFSLGKLTDTYSKKVDKFNYSATVQFSSGWVVVNYSKEPAE